MRCAVLVLCVCMLAHARATLPGTPAPPSFAYVVRLGRGWLGPLSLSANGHFAVKIQVPQHPGVTFYALPDSITHSERPPDRVEWALDRSL